MPRGIYERKNRKSKRADILRAAGKVYAHYGFEGAKLELIAREAGVSKSLVLEHFGSKQELIRTVADEAVRTMLEQVREIDNTPGITLRRRELLVHDLIKQDREVWCLIVGTILVPSFAFQQGGELTGYLQTACDAALAHLEEMREPSKETVRDYTFTAVSLHIGYIVGGNEDEFISAMGRHMDLYLKEL